MDKDIELIKKVDSVLSTAYNIVDIEHREIFLKEKLSVFDDFYEKIYSILGKYQYKEKNNEEQNQIADIVKNNIIRILNLHDILNVNVEKKDWTVECKYEDFLKDLLNAFINMENKYVEGLRYNLRNKREIKQKDIEDFESVLEYLNTKNEYIRVIKENNLHKFYEDECGYGSNNDYIIKFFNHTNDMFVFNCFLELVKANFMNLTKEQGIELLTILQNSEFLKDFNFEDLNRLSTGIRSSKCNILYSYSNDILEIKSNLMQNSLKDDIVLKQFWEGNFEEEEIIKDILDNISINSLMTISEYDSRTSEKGFIRELSEHFKNLNLSNRSIALILNKILEKDINTYEVARFLAQIDITDNYDDFKNSEYAKDFEWLLSYNVFKNLIESEQQIEDAYNPFLPAEYYIKKLDKLGDCQNVSEHFVENLITLLHTDYYSEEEKWKLRDALKHNGLYNEYITNEQIEFYENDTIEDTFLKVKQAFYSGQIIPIGIAKKILNEELDGKIQIDKELLKGCIQSIICNTLKEKNIDIQNKVFFGKGDKWGMYFPSQIAIWINDDLMEKYIDSHKLHDKVYLFETIFHEMQHAIQFDNMNKGKFDYLTYNFLKERIIYDEFAQDFYENNYRRIFIESDARKEMILGFLEFLNGLNPKFAKVIRDNVEKRYIDESEKYTIYTDSKKESFLGEIDVSDYLGLFIRYNPEILKEYEILQTQYHQDGTRKDVQELLEDFKEAKKNRVGVVNANNPNFTKEVYSLYYGLITEQIRNCTIEDENLQHQIDEFFHEAQDVLNMKDLVTERYMQICYHSVDSEQLQAMCKRIFDEILKDKRDETPGKEEK